MSTLNRLSNAVRSELSNGVAEYQDYCEDTVSLQEYCWANNIFTFVKQDPKGFVEKYRHTIYYVLCDAFDILYPQDGHWDNTQCAASLADELIEESDEAFNRKIEQLVNKYAH